MLNIVYNEFLRNEKPRFSFLNEFFCFFTLFSFFSLSFFHVALLDHTSSQVHGVLPHPTPPIPITLPAHKLHYLLHTHILCSSLDSILCRSNLHIELHRCRLLCKYTQHFTSFPLFSFPGVVSVLIVIIIIICRFCC